MKGHFNCNFINQTHVNFLHIEVVGMLKHCSCILMLSCTPRAPIQPKSTSHLVKLLVLTVSYNCNRRANVTIHNYCCFFKSTSHLTPQLNLKPQCRKHLTKRLVHPSLEERIWLLQEHLNLPGLIIIYAERQSH